MSDPMTPFETRLAARLGRRRRQRTLIIGAAMALGGGVSSACFAGLAHAVATEPSVPGVAIAFGAAVLLAATGVAAARGLGKR